MSPDVTDPTHAAMRERLHQALRSFYGDDFPRGRGDREAWNQEAVNNAARTLGVTAGIDNDRHYGQSDRAIFRFIPGRGLVDHFPIRDRLHQIETVQKSGGEYWEIFLLLSDLGPWIHLFTGHYTLDPSGKLKVSAPRPDQWPTAVSMVMDTIRQCFLEQGCIEPEQALLDESISLRPDFPVLDTPSTVYTHLFGEV